MRKNLRKLICVLTFVTLGSLLLFGCEEKEKEPTTDEVEATDSAEEEIVLETIERQVLVDEAGVQVILEGLTDSETYGKGVNLTFVNNTVQTLTFDCKRMIVNGIMTPDLFGERLLPGETKELTGYIGSGMFDYLGIDNVGEITFKFDFYETENYKSIYTSDDITVKTSAYEEMDTEADFDGKKVYEGCGVTIYGKYVEDDMFESAMLLYIENDADVEYLLKAEGITINDVFNEYLYTTTVCSGKDRFYYLEFTKDSLEAAGIEAIEELKMNLEFYDRDNETPLDEVAEIKISN